LHFENFDRFQRINLIKTIKTIIFSFMKANFSKQLRVSGWLMLGVMAGTMSSCKMPSAQRYDKAEWSVQTTVTKEDLPVGVTLEDVQEAPLPTDAEIAAGLPNHQGNDPWSVANLPTDALLNGQDEPHPVSDGLLQPTDEGTPEPSKTLAANDAPQVLPALDFPTEAAPLPVEPTEATPSLAMTTKPAAQPMVPELEVKPAAVEPTMENKVRQMAAISSRPPMSPRGVSLPAAEVASQPVKPENVAAVQSPVATPELHESPDLSEILNLAKQLETRKK
jgi:hypothetical protein